MHVRTIEDLRYSFRILLKNPGFAAVSLVCLALGIGATGAIFSVVNAVMLRPLPYGHPEQLVRVYSEFPNFPNGGCASSGSRRRNFWTSGVKAGSGIRWTDG